MLFVPFARYHKAKPAGKVLLSMRFHPDPRGSIRVPQLDVQGKVYVVLRP